MKKKIIKIYTAIIAVIMIILLIAMFRFMALDNKENVEITIIIGGAIYMVLGLPVKFVYETLEEVEQCEKI